MDPTNATVVIIGAGLAGLATAVYLARGGVDDVVVVDRLADPREGARSLGTVEPGVLEHAHRTDRALGRPDFAALLDFLWRNRELVDAEGLLEPTGVTWFARDPREAEDLRRSAATFRDLGHQVEDQAEGLPDATGVLHLPAWGRLDPTAAVDHLRAAAEHLGVRFVLGHAATLEKTEPVVVRAGGQAIEAEMVVLTAGIGCSTLHSRLDGSLTPVREAAIAVAHAASPAIQRAGHGWTLWTGRADRTLVSGARWATGHMEAGETDASAPHPRVLDRLEAFARESLGATGEVLDRWAWITCDTRDHLPLIGPLPGQPRVLVATGFGSNASSWSMAAARALVDGILAGETTAPTRLRSNRLVRWSR